MWTVYKHTTPSGKVYIGITHQVPENRWLCGHGYKTNKHFYNAINRYGWNNIKHEIVKNGLTQSQAEELERQLIFEYKSYKSEYGYNKALGGHALSEESRRKIAETRKKRKIQSWTLGKHHSESTKAKISQARKGIRYTLSEEAKQHISESKRGEKNPNYGRPLSEERIQQLADINSKPVYQLIGKEKKFYKSIRHASRITGITSGNIGRVCKGIRKTAGGFVWEYA